MYRPASPLAAILLIGFTFPLLPGCSALGPTNPSFDIDVRQAWTALDEMAHRPALPQRPVVLLAGWFDPGLAVGRLETMLADALGNPLFVIVHFAEADDFDACRQRVIDAVDLAYPSDDPLWTTEVDVIAISMGGLVARYAAADPDWGQPVRRLRIARLFTISTPHRGADFADLPAADLRQVDMRAGSEFLQRLAAAREDARYEIYPYARLGDRVVGVDNTAPGDDVPWWVPNRRLEFAHITAYRDPRIVADIARHLRGEQPFSRSPRSPLPHADSASSATHAK